MLLCRASIDLFDAVRSMSMQSLIEEIREILMKLIRYLYDWVLSFAESPYGVLALFLIAFAESAFLSASCLASFGLASLDFGFFLVSFAIFPPFEFRRQGPQFGTAVGLRFSGQPTTALKVIEYFQSAVSGHQ